MYVYAYRGDSSPTCKEEPQKQASRRQKQTNFFFEDKMMIDYDYYRPFSMVPPPNPSFQYVTKLITKLSEH